MADHLRDDLSASRDSFMDGSPNKPLQDQLNDEDETGKLLASITARTPEDREAEFRKYKAEQKEHMERKIQIQKRLEAMKREYHFLEQLDTKDVAYVQQKKIEEAAITVQRAFRRHKIRRKRMLRHEGVKYDDDDHLLPTEDELKQIDQNLNELKDKKIINDNARPDNFYAKIDDDRRKELKEEVERIRKGKFSADELRRKELDKIGADYDEIMKDWLDKYREKEAKRKTAYEQLKESHLMSDYLVDLDEEQDTPQKQLESQRSASQLSEKALEEKEKQQLWESKHRIEQIKVWSHISNNYKPEDIMQVKRNHNERLERYRNKRDWEDIEEDELDLEGDRILAEIKNYRTEKFFKTSFY